MTTVATIERAILRDREQRRARPKIEKTRPVQRAEFDPFSVRQWRIIAGSDLGHLPRAKRAGPRGFMINCGCCAREFESIGLRYCADCMEMPAAERSVTGSPAASERPCQRRGCEQMIPRRSRADAKYCTARCARKAQNARRGTQNGSRLSDTTPPDLSTLGHEIREQFQGPKIGPKIWPVNVVGGHRRPGDLTLDLDLVSHIFHCEVGA